MNRLLSLMLLGAIATGLSACVTTPDKREDLKAVFRDQIRACYKLPKEAVGAEPVVIEVRLRSNGALEHQPKVIGGSPDSILAKRALGALHQCAPFVIPAEWIPRYDDWKVMKIKFDPN